MLDYSIDKDMATKHIGIISRGGLFELRVLSENGQVRSGFFSDPVTAVRALEKAITDIDKENMKGGKWAPGAYHVCSTVQPLRNDFKARDNYGTLKIAGKNDAATDSDVTAYGWLVIDCDPVRLSKTSATNEQKNAAHDFAVSLREALRGEGFPDPIIVDSGNGYHLYYKTSIAEFVDVEVIRPLYKQFLQIVGMLHNTEEVKVDPTVYNPARVMKVAGTWARKGAARSETGAHHRLSKICVIPNSIVLNEGELSLNKLKLFISKYTAEETTAVIEKKKRGDFTNVSTSDETDQVKVILERHSIAYKEVQEKEYTKLLLDECPFDNSHKDSAIIIGQRHTTFHCFHASCSGHTYMDVLDILGEETSQAYRRAKDNNIYSYGRRNDDPRTYRTQTSKTTDIVTDESAGEYPVISIDQADALDEDCNEFISSGIKALDALIGGFPRGGLTVVTGTTGSGKTNFIAQISVAADNAKYHVLTYDGENGAKKNLKTKLAIAAGDGYTKSGTVSSDRLPDDEVKPFILNWLSQYERIIPMRDVADIAKLINTIREESKNHHPDLIIIDNHMMLDLGGLASATGRQSYEISGAVCQELRRVAQKTHTAIILCVHPTKSCGPLMTLWDVEGGREVTAKSDLVLIMHRRAEGWLEQVKKRYKWTSDDVRLKGSNCLEIAKSRVSVAEKDSWIPLDYRWKSKRLMPIGEADPKYGWWDAYIEDVYNHLPFD